MHQWWDNPRLAYGRGLSDGYELGHDAAITTILDILGRDVFRLAARTIDAHHQLNETQPTTPDHPRSWPRLAHNAPNNWPGLENMTGEQRQATWRRLIDSWEID